MPWQVNVTVIDVASLAPLATSEPWEPPGPRLLDNRVLVVGDDYLAGWPAAQAEGGTRVWHRQGLETVAELPFRPRAGFFVGPYLVLTSAPLPHLGRGNEVRIYRVGDAEPVPVASIELDELWDVEPGEGPLCGPPERGGQQLGAVPLGPDRLAVYVDYGSVVGCFERPPRLRSPFFALFELTPEGGLEAVAGAELPDSWFITDVALYPDGRLLVATADRGWVFVDARDFSVVETGAGGIHQRQIWAAADGPFTDWRQQYLAHRIHAVSPGGAVLADAVIPVDVDHKWQVQFWAPSGGSLVAVAEHDYSPQNGVLAGLGLGLGSMDDAGWYSHGHDDQGRLGITALLQLAEDRVLAAAEAELQQPLGEFFDPTHQLDEILAARDVEQLPAWLVWQDAAGETTVFPPLNPSRGEPVLARVRDRQIDWVSLASAERAHLVAVDAVRGEAFLRVEERLMRLALDDLWAP